jgi:hypothetical protein
MSRSLEREAFASMPHIRRGGRLEGTGGRRESGRTVEVLRAAAALPEKTKKRKESK